jgi:UPF0716 protein FxsA
MELWLLFRAGAVIGGVNTLFVVILTGIIGAGLAKNQGRAILGKIQKDMSQGKMPADQLIHGFLVFAGGLLLLTPGFFTDFIGLSLVFPLTRSLYISNFKKGLEKRIKNGSVQFYYSQSGGGFSGSNPFGGQANKPEQEAGNQKRVYRQGGHDVIDVDAIKDEN